MSVSWSVQNLAMLGSSALAGTGAQQELAADPENSSPGTGRHKRFRRLTASARARHNKDMPLPTGQTK